MKKKPFKKVQSQNQHLFRGILFRFLGDLSQARLGKKMTELRIRNTKRAIADLDSSFASLKSEWLGNLDYCDNETAEIKCYIFGQLISKPLRKARKQARQELVELKALLPEQTARISQLKNICSEMHTAFDQLGWVVDESDSEYSGNPTKDALAALAEIIDDETWEE